MGAAMDRNTLGPSPGAERAPDHRVEISQAPGRWKVAVDGVRVADSTGVLALDETGYDRALYFPPEDVAVDKLAASDTRTTCPFKGEARLRGLDPAGRGGADCGVRRLLPPPHRDRRNVGGDLSPIFRWIGDKAPPTRSTTKNGPERGRFRT